jgi:hypothetical protein
MCTPLQLMVIGVPGKSGSLRYVPLYHAARLLTYTGLGALAGFFGKGLGLQEWQQQSSLLSGLILLFAFAAFYLLKLDQRLSRLFFPYLSRMRGRLQQNKSSQLLYYSGSGMLNGLLPCGMVYLAIFPAMASESTFGAASYMLLFGLGTLPLLLLGNASGLRFLQSSKIRWERYVPWMIILTATLLILRGMDLGIPFLSPQMPIEGASVESCK